MIPMRWRCLEHSPVSHPTPDALWMKVHLIIYCACELRGCGSVIFRLFAHYNAAGEESL